MTITIDPEVELKNNHTMIHGLCWKFAQTYPIDYDTCLSEAYFAFVKACADFNPDKGMKFSSWCYYWVWCKLKDLVMKRSKAPKWEEIDEETVGEAPPVSSPCLEVVEDLSEDAQEIISLILETPAELSEGLTNAKDLLRRVKSYLVQQGKSKVVVDRAHQEITIKFQEVWAG